MKIIAATAIVSTVLMLAACATGPRKFAPLGTVSCAENKYELGTTVLIDVSEKDQPPVVDPADCYVVAGQWLRWSNDRTVRTFGIAFKDKTADANGGKVFETDGEGMKAPDVAIKIRKISGNNDVSHAYSVTTNGNMLDPAIIIRPRAPYQDQ